MASVLNGKSGSGSLHLGKDLANVSNVPLARAGRHVGYTDPVARHVQTTPAYPGRVYNQYVKTLNLPSSAASSPASLGNLTGKKVVMHMHFNSDTYEERVRAHSILHQPTTRKDGSSMVVLESCVNVILKLGPALLAVGALTSTDEWQNGVIIVDTLGTLHPSNWAKLNKCVIVKKD